MVIQSGMMIALDPLSKIKVDSAVKLKENVLQLNANVILRSNFRLQLKIKLTIGALWDFL